MNLFFAECTAIVRRRVKGSFYPCIPIDNYHLDNCFALRKHIMHILCRFFIIETTEMGDSLCYATVSMNMFTPYR